MVRPNLFPQYFLHTCMYDASSNSYTHKLYRPTEVVPQYVRSLLDNAADKCVMSHIVDMIALLTNEAEYEDVYKLDEDEETQEDSSQHEAHAVAKRFIDTCAQNRAYKIEERLFCNHHDEDVNRLSLALIQPVKGKI